MGARYLVRFDDICPTMNWDVWEHVESLLIEADIRPIVAIVPDNRDDSLVIQAPNPEFWERARKWQSLGWTIGWHGYQHVYDTASAGLVGLNRRSEFAGHPTERQQERLGAALEIFTANDILPQLWVAPGHSFDQVTVEVLGKFGIDVISDGFFTRSVRYHGAIWLPQQLWRFRRMPFGLWTVCAHINAWSPDAICSFAKDLGAFRERITCVEEALRSGCSVKNVVDSSFAELYRCAVIAKREIGGLAALRRRH